MYPFNFISVGIDVSADFSWISILLPDHSPFVKPFKVSHNSLDSLQKAANTIKKAEESNSLKAHIFLESTGIYHYPLFCYLTESGFEVFVLNPLITDSNKNSGIRKVKNDKSDSIRIAKTAFTDNLKVSLMPSDLVINLRSLIREYYYLSDVKSSYVNKLHKELRMVFPSYSNIFSSITSKTSLLILKTYKTPLSILKADKDGLIQLIKFNSRHGLDYATKKYENLIEAAKLAKYFGKHLESVFDIIQMEIELIEIIQVKIDNMLLKIKEYTIKYADDNFIKQIYLLDTINGIGFISAVTLMCEIGDFSAFKKPKQLFAYFGLDPQVKESGKFKGTRISMSKRGSTLARRVMFSVVLASVRTLKTGLGVNPTLKEYYDKKKESKPKMVAIGAVMHKLSNIIFAVLRDNRPYIVISKEEHCKNYNAKITLAA